jgi:hypothetical protein
MRRALPAVIAAAVVALVVAYTATADTPTTGGGLSRVQHNDSLEGSGTTAAPLKLRVCGAGSGIVSDGTSWDCSSGGAGDITGVTANAPISGGGTSGTVAIGLTTCSAGEIYKMAGGVWTCSADAAGTGDITGVTAGTSMTGGGSSGDVTLNVSLPGASCAASEAVTAISASGTGTCSTVGDITAVGATANMGLTGGSSSGAATLGLLSTCTDGQVLKSGSSGTTWSCDDDDVGGGGITNSAGSGIVMRSDGTNAIASSMADDGTTVTVQGFKGTVQTASVSGTVSDFSLNASTTTLRLTTTGTTTLTGITGGSAGRKLDVCVDDTGWSVSLNHNVTSTAGNRFFLPDQISGWQLPPDGCAKLEYDGTDSRWKIVGWGSNSFPKLVIPTVATFTTSAITLVVAVTTTDNLSATGTANTFGDADTDYANSRATLAFSGTDPTINSCGAGASVSGEAQSFQLTVGAAVTSCVVNLGRTFNSAPFCTFSAANDAASADVATSGGNADSPYITSTTTTVTMTFDANSESSPVYNVFCPDRR